jgi:electron-transferring-flavoprotein dehydrogenase
MEEPKSPLTSFVPAHFQPDFAQDVLILKEAPGEEAVPLDVVFVGGGPSGLAGAIELARLAKKDAEEGGGLGELEIGVLEKSENLGEHCMSGAVINPVSFRALFPDLGDADFPFRTPVTAEALYLLRETGQTRLPTPPTMNNHGNFVASICEIVRWLGSKAEGLGVNLFTGFPADALLAEGRAVTGVRTTPAGLKRDGTPGSTHMPAMDIASRITVLTEGTRGTLAGAWRRWQQVGSKNPQIYALGVKEIWEVRKPLESVIHTMGWPLPRNAFGGSWIYPMADDLISIGLVVGLDYRQHALDVHVLLQRLKGHPLVRSCLEGGELLEWGAKTIPEGGFFALPDRLHGDGLLLAGDAAGFVDVPSLKGIHYAMMSGILAARAAFRALKADDVSAAGLASYDEEVAGSWIRKDLYKTRNMRPAFKSGFYAGGIKAGLMMLTGGAFPGGRIAVEPDELEPRTVGPKLKFTPDNKLTISKIDAVYKSGNKTRDDIPSHLEAGEDVPTEVAEFYAAMCPAGVFECEDGKLVVNPPNCVDCKTTDILGPRWRPREGGAGTKYKQM